MEYKKKLIEVALPLEAINLASAREKSMRHGHPSTLHLWWARRPLAAARAVIFSSLVDDPSSNTFDFPTEEAQEIERNRLFKIIEDLVKWENSNNEVILSQAKSEILKYNNESLPDLLDPFAGGGSIPLEAQRLGLKAHASDLNPVAVMINKAMIEIPSIFSGLPPVNPESRRKLVDKWEGASGIAEDVKYYGEWLRDKAFEQIGDIYPSIQIPDDKYDSEATVIAWIWTRTIKCPNPACGCEMPLASSFELSKKSGKEAYVQPIIKGNSISYEVKFGEGAPKPPKIARGKFRCICCGETVVSEYVRSEFNAKRSGRQLLAIVGDGPKGRIFLSPCDEHVEIADSKRPTWKPEADMNQECTDLVSGRGYGFKYWHELFTDRQLIALTTLSDLVRVAQKKIGEDAKLAGMIDDSVKLSDGGTGALAYGDAIGVYLAFLVDQVANHSSSFCGWNSPNTQMRGVFARQAIPMIWDYAESNVFSNSSGSYNNLLDRLCKGFIALGRVPKGTSLQFDAQSDLGLRNIMVSTDPPYYDNIGYADLSDFFYIWMRRALKDTYPKLFRTMLVPKAEELVASAYRFSNDHQKASDFFESGMVKAFKQIYLYSRSDIPVTIYYAFKQSESYEDDSNARQTSSPGWEAILSAIIKAGFSITGTWPIRTEKPGRSIEIGTNALASSIVLVCRKRNESESLCTRRDFINILRKEIKPALQNLKRSNIAPVDLSQSAIGPGISVYSRFSKVLEADGTPMSVRSALFIINQELDHYFSEQDGELDSDSRFCVDLYSQYAFNNLQFGDADVLARAKNTSVDKLANRMIIQAQKGIVRLLTREEIPKKVEHNEQIIWLLTQQLTHAIEKGGIEATAKIVAEMFGSNAEVAKSLAYRLFTIAERKGWVSEAYAYNSLVIAWPDVLTKATEIRSQVKNAEQIKFL